MTIPSTFCHIHLTSHLYFCVQPEEIREAVRGMAKESGEGFKVPPFPCSMLGIPEDSAEAALVQKYCTPHPLAALEEEVVLTGEYKKVAKKTFIVTELFQGFHAEAEKVKDAEGWASHRFDTHHDCMLSMPKELAEVLRSEL